MYIQIIYNVQNKNLIKILKICTIMHNYFFNRLLNKYLIKIIIFKKYYFNYKFLKHVIDKYLLFI